MSLQPPFVASVPTSEYFASLIKKELGAEELGIERRVFRDGEKYYRIKIEDKSDLIGRDIIFVGSTTTDNEFLELLRIGSAMAEHGVHRRIFVMPFLGYSTMERATKNGEVVTTKINAKLLSSIAQNGKRDIFLMMDLHSHSILHYFEGGCLRFELSSEPVLSKAISSLNLKNVVFASADLGRPVWVQNFAEKFKTEMAFISKIRDFETTQVSAVIGDVKEKNVIIYDDMTRSGSSLIKACDAYLENGAKSVHAVLSHLALNDESIIDKLENSDIKNIISTNSHPMSQHEKISRSKKIVVIDVSNVFVDWIKKLISN